MLPYVIQCVMCSGGSFFAAFAGWQMITVIRAHKRLGATVPKARYHAAFYLTGAVYFGVIAVFAVLTLTGTRPLPTTPTIYTWIGTGLLALHVLPATAMALSWLGLLPD